MSKAIIREATDARPWQQVPRPTPQAWVPGSQPSTADGAAAPGTSGSAGPIETPADAEAWAAQLAQRAEGEAERIVQQAREAADQLRVTAFREGFADGQARGWDESAALREELRAIVDQIGSAYHRFCLNQVPELVALATAAAEKLLGAQLTQEPEHVATIVQQALEHLVASTRVTLHLNPADIEIIRGRLPLPCDDAGQPSPNAGAQPPRVLLLPDPAVQRGGCWIESEHGEVDATVSGRVARLSEVLGAVEHGATE